MNHDSTPASVLEAPEPTRDPVWITTVIDLDSKFRLRRAVRPAFVGDVERDLLRVTVGVSRKGRKIRRPTTRKDTTS